jgi:hypothetical protein
VLTEGEPGRPDRGRDRLGARIVPGCRVVVRGEAGEQVDVVGDDLQGDPLLAVSPP